MTNTRQDLIGKLVERKLYPKKKSTNIVLPDGSSFFKASIPLVNPNTIQRPNQTGTLPKKIIPPIQRPNQTGTLPKKIIPPNQRPVTKIEFPTKPLQKILFLKRTLGI